MTTVHQLICWFFAGFLLSACAASGSQERYSGYYRQAFEQNDFYTMEDEGPYWLDMSDMGDATGLKPFHVEKPGRGSHTTVCLTFHGYPSEMPDFVGSENYSGQLTVTEILTIDKLDEDAFFAATQNMRETGETGVGDDDQ